PFWRDVPVAEGEDTKVHVALRDVGQAHGEWALVARDVVFHVGNLVIVASQYAAHRFAVLDQVLIGRRNVDLDHPRLASIPSRCSPNIGEGSYSLCRASGTYAR